MDRQLFLASKKIMLTVFLLLAISYVQAQETKEPLTLTLDKALEIALSDNPTIKVAEEEIALKKVANKETWQSLLPEASIGGTWNHTITAAQMNLRRSVFQNGSGRFEYSKRNSEYQLTVICPFGLQSNVYDENRHRVGSRKIPCF